MAKTTSLNPFDIRACVQTKAYLDRLTDAQS